MKGFVPVPPPLTLTENTGAFVRRVMESLRATKRAPTRRDWLLSLLAAHPIDLSTHLLRMIDADCRTLHDTVGSSTYDSDSWFEDANDQFTSQDVETIARELGHRYVGTEHFLLVFTRAPGPLGDQLRAAGLTWERVVEAFNAIEWGAPPENAT